MESGVRYCTADDGVRIAYTVEGDGPPLMLVHNIYSFSLAYLVPNYDDTVHRIGRGRTLVRYDWRGTGLSQRDAADLSSDAAIHDIEAVIDALRLERVILLGATVGGVRVIEYAIRHPDRVAGLILYESLPCLTEVYPQELLESTAKLARSNWRFSTRSVADVAIRRLDEEEGVRWEELTYKSTTGENMARLIEAEFGHDLSSQLPRIACPTLVCHAREDPLWPFEQSVRMAEAIPDARLVPLEGHEAGPFTNAQSAIDAIDAFIATLPPIDVPASPDELARPLTPRETEVLRLIAAGRTSKEISDELSLSVRTVGRHITNIYDKIGARGRADATSFALRTGLLGE